MTKKQKANLFEIIFGLTFLTGFYIWYKFSLSIIGLLAVLIVPLIFAGIIIRLIPSKAGSIKKNIRANNSNKINSKGKKTFSSNVNQENNLLRSEKVILTLPLEELSWREFERLCYLYYNAKGYKPTETSEGADGGVDLIIYNRHHKANVAIQIKHWKSGKQITVKEIRELATAKKNHRCSLADFITTSSFTSAALKEADKNQINCFDFEWVTNKILRWREKEAIKRNLA